MNKHFLIIFCCLLVLGFVCYSNILNGEFIFDDKPVIQHNQNIRDITDVSSIWLSEKFSRPARFIPLLTFALNFKIHQFHTFGYHLVNVLIHVINASLVYLIISFLLKIVGKEEQYQNFALVAALIFITHPLQTQAVSYITQRFASLATLFYLGSIACYLKGQLTFQYRTRFYVLAIILGFLGMYSKEIVLTLPVSILLIDWLFFKTKPSWKKCAILLIGFSIIPSFSNFDIGRHFIVEAPNPNTGAVQAIPYFITQLGVVVHYLRLFIWPFGQVLDYDWPVNYSLWDWRPLLSGIILGAMVVYGYVKRKEQPLMTFAIFWIFLTLSIESSFKPFRNIVFEHRTYLPSLGMCLVLTLVLHQFLEKRKMFFNASLIIVLCLSILTISRNKVWQTRVAMWEDVVRKSPHKERAQNNLGLAYLERAQFNAAIQQFNKVILLNPTNKDVYLNRGLTFVQLKEYELALEDYNRALALNAKNGEVYNNRASLLTKMGKHEEAFSDLKKALGLMPDSAEVYTNLGNYYGRKADYPLALDAYQKALEIEPFSYQALYSLGNVYELTNQLALALQSYNQVLKIKPNFTNAYYHRANIYFRNNKPGKALADFERVLQLDPGHVKAKSKRDLILATLNETSIAPENYF